jgi:stringent starvation protein B
MTQLLPPKKEVALALLERSNVDVYLDPRAKGVVVPPQFRKEPRLILKIGLNMPVPIPDLRLDDESMSCTLSFNRAKFYCVVPWLSVFAMVGDDGRGMVWPDDVPQELAVRVVDEPERAPTPEPPDAPEAARAKPRLSPAERPEEARSKKPRKKKEAPRPVLVAVPSPDRAPEAERAPQKKPRAPAPRSPAAQGAPPRTPPRVPGAPPSRPKRELPPYLRVVK